jgi:hypothetical protein
MTKIWIFYKIFARKVYSRRVKGWKNKARSLALLTILQNASTIFILTAMLLNDYSIFVFITEHHMPWGPVVGIIAGLILLIQKALFKKKLNSRRIGQIKKAYSIVNKISRKSIIITFVFLHGLFFLTFFILLNKFGKFLGGYS